MEKYRFNEKRHIHQLLIDDKWCNLTGCTTVLSVLAKPALIPWAANMTAKFLKTQLKEIKLLDQKGFESLLDEARKAHCKRRDKAGDYGTIIHEKVHKIIQGAISNNDGHIQKSRMSKEKSIQNFIDWAIKNKVKFLATEQHIYSEELFIGGIVDFVCEIDGQLWLGDIKTSKSGIWPDNFWQCAGYHLMLEAMKLYPGITGYLILNLKESGEILEKRNISIKENKEVFLACLKIYRTQQKIKNNI